MYNKGIQLHTSAKRYRPSGYDTRGSLYKGNSGDLHIFTLVTLSLVRSRRMKPPRFRDESADVFKVKRATEKYRTMFLASRSFSWFNGNLNSTFKAIIHPKKRASTHSQTMPLFFCEATVLCYIRRLLKSHEEYGRLFLPLNKRAKIGH